MMRLFGSSSVELTHAEKTLTLHTKCGKKRSLLEICRKATPPCRLNPLLFNGHLQTAWTVFQDDGPKIQYKRRVFEAEDPRFEGHFAIDFVTKPPSVDGHISDARKGLEEDPFGVGHVYLPPQTTYFSDHEFDNLGSNDNKPLLILLHGLAGGSHEPYIRRAIEPLIAPTYEGQRNGLSGGNWEALVVISRGCAGTKITSPMLYNARTTWDLRQVVKWARSTWPNRPLFGLGFSLGASLLTNYVAEENGHCLLSAACVASCPFNLDLNSKALQRTWMGREIYSKYMCKRMMGLVDLHQDIILENKAINPEKIAEATYLHEFDREVQCPSWGYPSEGAYHRDASSCDLVMSIRTPFFAIHAKDDPIAFEEGIPYEEIRRNPYIVLCTTAAGGHLSWFELGSQCWFIKPVTAFLNEMWRHIDFENSESMVFDPSAMDTGRHSPPFVFEPLQRRTVVAT